jgi:ubiquinol-cytochrome c reductase cytochrome b subunit
MKEKREEPFFPHHVIKQIVQMILVLTVVISLASFFPAPMLPKADPFTTPEHIKPEWYFLAGYQFLKLAEKLSFLGQGAPKLIGVLGQGLAIAILILFPFFDKNKERFPKKRPFAIMLGILAALGFIGMSIWGYYS